MSLPVYTPKYIDKATGYEFTRLADGVSVIPSNWENLYTIYFPKINNALLALAKLSKFNTVNSLEYANLLVDQIYIKLEDVKCNQKISDSIGILASRSLTRLKQEGLDIITGLSHGDLKFDHIFLFQSSLKIIDWETVSIRSLMFDTINLVAPWISRRPELAYGLEDFLIRSTSELLQPIELVSDLWLDEIIDTYVQVYILERIKRVLEVSSKSYDYSRGLTRAHDLSIQFDNLRN